MNRELNGKIALALGIEPSRQWVIGVKEEGAIALATEDGYNPITSRGQAQALLEQQREQCKGNSRWDSYEVWELKTYPRFCEEITSTWSVVNVMVEGGFEFETKIVRNLDDEILYAARFWPTGRFNPDEHPWTTSHESTGDAVCRAALRAKMATTAA